MVTQANEWKSNTDPTEADVDLPSGNVARLTRPGMEAFIASGAIPNSLLGIVTETLEKAKAGSEMDEKDESKVIETLTQDPTKLADVFKLVDSVCLQVIKAPKVAMPPTSAEVEANVENSTIECDAQGRRVDTVYLDRVDLADKFFIFNYAVGGTSQLEPFRAELGRNMELVQSGQAAVVPTKRTGGGGKSGAKSGGKSKSKKR